MSKNVVNAPINAGANSIVGDGNIINFVNGLEILQQEYRDQLTNITNLIKGFKPITALGLLEELEVRLNANEIEQKEQIQANIFYLKGLCKSDIEKYKKEDSALNFIKAYRLNKSDETIRNRACIEYLNLQENDKANLLADEILKNDEFNFAGWFVKCVLADDLSDALTKVPKVIIQNPDFISSIIFRIIRKEGFDSFDDLKKYSLEFKFDIEQFKELTYDKKLKWIINIDLLINKFYSEFPIRYVSGETLIVENNPSLDFVLQLLEKYVSTLDKTELSDSITPYRFYYHYFKYLVKNDVDDYLALIENYEKLTDNHWTFTVCVCQVLNHKKEFEKSLLVLDEYKNTGGETVPEYYVFKAIVLDALGKNDEVEEMFMQYLELKDTIDERTALNLFATFFTTQKRYSDYDLYRREYEALQRKNFEFPELKELVDATLKINFLNDKSDEVKKQLRSIKIENFSLTSCKTLIVRNFAGLELRQEAIDCLEKFVDKAKISEELYLYIQLLLNQLNDKDDEGRRYKEVLQLLEFWRNNTDYIEEQFLLHERRLYEIINDFNNVEIIDRLLHKHFPNNEKYQFFLLLSLYNKKDIDELEKFSETLKDTYENESFGVNISKLLLTNKINTEKAFSILFDLAQNKNNTQARRAYFTHSMFFPDYLKQFEEVAIGNWVVYSINNENKKIEIAKDEGFQGKFIGKKVGDVFYEITKMTGISKEIKILEVHNEAMNLFREITDEAHNPLNELGFESFQIPEKIENIDEFFKDLFGAQGTEQTNYIEKNLNEYYNYAIGFSEITKAVFKEDFIDAYNHLTLGSEHRFTTLPNNETSDLLVNDYGLDFSSLILFYNLEMELGFKFKHKFKISYQIKSQIEGKIEELQISPPSKMSVNITHEKVEKFIYPENFNELRIEYLQKVLEWVNNNCEIDNVQEKLETYPKLLQNGKHFDSDFASMMVDSLYMATRQEFRLISSDSFIFLRTYNMSNIMNPEKYLKTYYPEKCDEVFYRQLLKWNYIGIDINLGVLKNEFIDYLAGKENYYLKAIGNLSFSLHNNPAIIYNCAKFLKEIYLMPSVSIENKNRYTFDVISNSFYKMPMAMIARYETAIKTEFKLLGTYYDEMLNVFRDVKKLYNIF